jgi:hypothetical protein
MDPANRHDAHSNSPQRLDPFWQGLVLTVAMAKKLILTVPPREELSRRADSKGFTPAGKHAAHMHSPEPQHNGRPECIVRFKQESMAPVEDGP